MATVIDHRDTSSDSGMGMVFGIIMLLIVAALFFMYVVPYIGNTLRAPQINVPGQIDVNINQPK